MLLSGHSIKTDIPTSIPMKDVLYYYEMRLCFSKNGSLFKSESALKEIRLGCIAQSKSTSRYDIGVLSCF